MTEKIGILFSSYGDIDDMDELEDYYKRSYMSFVPGATDETAEAAWEKDKDEQEAVYAPILPTNYRSNSQDQTEKIQSLLRAKPGLETITTYYGFNFATPYIPTTLDTIQRDGVTKLFVVNQSAPYSTDTIEKGFKEVKEYLKSDQGKDWSVEVFGLCRFSRDQRFINLMVDRILQRIGENFSGISPANICIFVPIHGIPRFSAPIDSYDDEVDALFNDLQTGVQLNDPNYTLMKGFQNHGSPAMWLTPEAETVANQIANNPDFTHVLIDGKISFTIDCVETLDEQRTEFKEIIAAEKGEQNVFVEWMFNGDEEFAVVMADILAEVVNQGTEHPNVVSLPPDEDKSCCLPFTP